MDKGVGVRGKGTDAQPQPTALEAIGAAVHRSLRLDDVLDTIFDGVMHAVEGISGCEIHLVEGKERTLFTKAHRGLPPWLIEAGSFQPGEGLAGQVAEAREALFLEDLSQDARVDGKRIRKQKLQSYFGVPILCDEEFLGVLSAFTTTPTILSEDQRNFLAGIGRSVGRGVKNALLYEQAANRTRRFTTISRAITVTRQLGTLEGVLQDISKVLVQSLGFDQSWIGLVDASEEKLQGRVGFGMGRRVEIVTEDPISEDASNPAVASVLRRKPFVYRSMADAPAGACVDRLKKNGVKSFCYLPILTEEKAVGVIGVFYTTEQAFDEEDVKTLSSVADQASIAIENARLYEEVSQSEERYRTLFEASGTSLVIVDEDHVFALVNHAFEILSGYGREAVVGKKAFSEFILDRDGDLADRLREPPGTWEAEFKDKDGMIRQVHLTTTRLPGTSNILLSLSDMTKERELERHLFRTEELAAIGELSAGIAHEIRNPLVAITTSVSLLKDETGLSEEGRELLDVVKEESDHLAAIVDDFLRFARPKTPTLEKENVVRLLSDTVRRCRDWKDSSIDVVESYEGNLPQVGIDRHQIQQVITNLLLNAVDAMDGEGTLEISAKKEKGSAEDRVRISVTDSGIGIPEDELSKIFQPFYSTKDKGTGLGLAICRRIVFEHGGDIFVDSTPEEGTSFSVVLPVESAYRKPMDT